MNKGPTDKELIDWAIKNKRVDILVKHKWGFDLAPGQIEMVRKIAFLESNRISISAMTRYGKTQCVAFGMALLIDFGVPARIAFIGPKQEQAGILRQYLADLILADKSLLSKAQIYVTGEERIGKEASRKRMTFNTGAEYRVFSAEGEADRLMGFGADIVIKDEACLISRTANAKIMRMLGDNPDNGVLIELYNPWNRDNVAFEHTMDPEFDVLQIGWSQAVKEGRTTQKFVNQQKKDLTPLEFTVLYDSQFPDQSEDSLFSLEWINMAEKTRYSFQERLDILVEQIKKLEKSRQSMGESEFVSRRRNLQQKLDSFRKIIACDPAEMGLDETVIVWGIEFENKFEVVGTYFEAKSDPMRVVGKIIDIAETFIEKEVKGTINIDRIGIGSGPLSRLKEVISEKNMKNIHVVGCHFGERAIKKDMFLNKKSENYFRLADIMRENLIDMPENYKIRNQLIAERWERTSANKKKVIDPEEKSPDWCFVGDTLIDTIKGKKKIKEIQKGDLILTPFGFRKALGLSKRKTDILLRTETNKSNILYSTPNHKIYTNETFKYMKDLEYTNELENNNIFNLIKWRLKNLLSTKGEDIGFQEHLSTIMQTSMMGQGIKEGKRKHYIEQSGKIQTKKKYQKDSLFTILMEILLITKLKILNLLQIKNIDNITIKKDLRMMNIEEKTKKILKKPKIWLRHGINLKKEKNGIKNIMNLVLRKLNFMNLSAKTAIKYLKQHVRKRLDSVQEDVLCKNIEMMDVLVQKKNVFIVEKNISKNINFLKERLVRQDVLHFKEKKIDIYNITVDKDHVYYANNLLVSNCDALVYFVWKDNSGLAFGFA